jgi:ribosome biogenesis GTPase
LHNLAQYDADERLLTLSHSFPGLTLSRVTAQQRNQYTILTELGESPAEVSGKLRHEALSVEDYPTVGDFVLVKMPQNGDSGSAAVIQQVLPRKSAFIRKAAGTGHDTQVVAANIDVAFLCMSLNENYNIRRLERYLAVAWESGATPVVLLTKADLCEHPADILAQVRALAAGAEVLITSVLDPTTRQTILSFVPSGVTAAFLGSSGVGKSSIINLLTEDAVMATAEISSVGKGRHTTTHRQLLPVVGGGVVIDTPGMRELGVEAIDLRAAFADIDALAAACRFTDCRHESEPGCAVREALENGTLDKRRLENYHKLQREARYDGLTNRQRETRKREILFGVKKSANKTGHPKPQERE